ncbi:MAG: hypothetical protein ABL893_18285 [Hyphomicrobium sp.]
MTNGIRYEFRPADAYCSRRKIDSFNQIRTQHQIVTEFARYDDEGNSNHKCAAVYLCADFGIRTQLGQCSGSRQCVLIAGEQSQSCLRLPKNVVLFIRSRKTTRKIRETNPECAIDVFVNQREIGVHHTSPKASQHALRWIEPFQTADPFWDAEQ